MANEEAAKMTEGAGEQQLQMLGTETVNTALDAPTIFVDAIQGANLSEGLTKLNFIEQMIPYGESRVKGRYVVNLAIPSGQLRSLGTVLIGLADQIGK